MRTPPAAPLLRLLRLLCVGWMMGAGAFALPAHGQALRAEVTPVALRTRTAAPAIYEIKIHRPGQTVMEGTLEAFTTKDGSEIFVQRLPDVVLSTNTQSFRLVTPPLPAAPTYASISVRLRFVTKEKSFDLGRHDIESGRRSDIGCIIAVCDGFFGAERTSSLWTKLRVESFYVGASKGNQPVESWPAFFSPSDLPSNPLDYFAFDLVLVEGRGFAALREKQLTALLRWVEAGGTLCVLPDRELKDEHARFLDTLGAVTGSTLGAVTSLGEWAPERPEPRMLDCGLGRVVVAPAAARESAAWPSLAAFLWKVRPSIAEKLIRGDTSEMDLAKALSIGSSDGYSRSRAMEAMLFSLLPQTTRLPSAKIFAMIFGGFLLVIGPLDWFVLGYFRRRRWTWVLFPLTSVATALLVMEVARASLGTNDFRTAIVISDVGSGGRILRENRLDLLFTARRRVASEEYRQAFSSPFAFRSYENADGAMPEYSGPIPARQTLVQSVPQWTPMGFRVISLPPPETTPVLPWGEIETEIVNSADPVAGLATMATRLPGWDCVLYYGGKEWLPPSQSLQSSNPKREVSRSIAALTVSPVCGLGQFVAQAAPHGGYDFGDMLLLDPSHPKAWVLVISRPSAAGFEVWRYPFHTR